LLAGCVTEVYRPGGADNPLHGLKLGQSYGDMVKLLGLPSQSVSQDRSGETYATSMIPIVGLVVIATNNSPSSVQSYHYDRIGTVMINNSNQIVRIEGELTGPSIAAPAASAEKPE
jgi:hypothetical protein